MAIMCVGGTSLFAEGGSIYQENANRYKTQAVDDMVSDVQFVIEAQKDGLFDEKEKKEFLNRQNNFDLNYGAGSFRFVWNEMNEFSKSPGEKNLSETSERKQFSSLKFSEERTVKKTFGKQKELMYYGKTLNDYEYQR